MQSFDISRQRARIIEARFYGVSRADCMVMELAGGRDPAKTIPCSPVRPSGKRDGSYRRQELS
ncbi:hypothetical protein SCB29_21250 [Paraburkholderia sp. SIMBA_055]|jgi:hypothetical protein|uniref:Uncharacterized protein n=1 Tax=Paraburkholderia graminis TaxID=60548 RepID=A0ABD5CAL4_9BURK|nr:MULTISPECIES: hypothetical protein [Paraburkholderia]ALE56249.1 hypothetical protein AC233_17370 [Burkholderia sp. HB1]MBW8837564.1 hypothetical protein [Burkholderia sp.]AXF09489.1 hypothetical protein CUJ91_17305 [Paraburkholderia graminis]MDQ0621120.1 hypothetical protein [Paraburkholderia graminis]MDR6202221.1 hypothetical protein [Paraburkholderia graminis]